MKTDQIDVILKDMAKVYTQAAEDLKAALEDSSLNPDEKFGKMVAILTKIGAIQ